MLTSLLGLVLFLALTLTWPPQVEVSTGFRCEVMHTDLASGDCRLEVKQGLALWWRTCAFIEWAGRTIPPYRMDLYVGESAKKADKACWNFKKAYEKVRGASSAPEVKK
jgi:hypothetical protein